MLNIYFIVLLWLKGIKLIIKQNQKSAQALKTWLKLQSICLQSLFGGISEISAELSGHLDLCVITEMAQWKEMAIKWPKYANVWDVHVRDSIINLYCITEVFMFISGWLPRANCQLMAKMFFCFFLLKYCFGLYCIGDIARIWDLCFQKNVNVTDVWVWDSIMNRYCIIQLLCVHLSVTTPWNWLYWVLKIILIEPLREMAQPKERKFKWLEHATVGDTEWKTAYFS